MKRCFWYISAGIVLATLFSCQLPDSGRMAVVNVDFSQPDLVRDLYPGKQSTRTIPQETETISVVMYPSYPEDVLDEEDFALLYEGELDPVLEKPDTRVLYFSYGQGISRGSLENIEPGQYSFTVLTFVSPVSDLATADFNDVLSWRIKKNVEVAPGINIVDLPLKLNTNYYDIPFKDITDPDITTSASAEGYEQTIFLSLGGFQPGECRIKYNPGYLVPDTAQLLLYSEEGYLLDSTPTKTDDGEDYLSFKVPGPSFNLIISARLVEYSYSLLQMHLYNGSYKEGPPQSITLDLYTGGS